MLRNRFEFEADFPDDAEWDSSNELITPGGKGLSRYLAAEMQKQGFRCSEPEMQDGYGWEFAAELGGTRISCVLQGGRRWLLTVDCDCGVIAFLISWRHSRKHHQVLDVIGRTLASSPRFSSVCSLTLDEYSSNCRRRVPEETRDCLLSCLRILGLSAQEQLALFAEGPQDIGRLHAFSEVAEIVRAEGFVPAALKHLELTPSQRNALESLGAGLREIRECRLANEHDIVTHKGWEAVRKAAQHASVVLRPEVDRLAD